MVFYSLAITLLIPAIHYTFPPFISNVAVEWLAVLLHIWMVPISNLSQETSFPYWGSHGFPHSHHTNAIELGNTCDLYLEGVQLESLPQTGLYWPQIPAGVWSDSSLI